MGRNVKALSASDRCRRKAHLSDGNSVDCVGLGVCGGVGCCSAAEGSESTGGALSSGGVEGCSSGLDGGGESSSSSASSGTDSGKREPL